ncbi:MAG: hypothetical protein JW809_05550 [Pirellulales bacterium]|nr:hypothetical protein [Pirellulales bacterium]
MKKGSFRGRGAELENQFFLERDRELLQAMREQSAAKEKKKALSDASGITDDALLEKLIALDLCGETVVALSLFPLIAVAWADGSIAAKERQAALDAARQQGMDQTHSGYLLLERWLARKPDAGLLTAWKGHVATLVKTLDEPAKNALKANVLGRARAVAETAGGLLGFGNKVSKSEQAVLSELERAFD